MSFFARHSLYKNESPQRRTRSSLPKLPLDWPVFLPHALAMSKAFRSDTALSDCQLDVILARYGQLKNLPLHQSLAERAVVLIEKQDNRALFTLFDQGFKEFGPLYPLVLIYCLYPTILGLYERVGIAESVRQATLSDIAIWVKTYEDQHSGETGLDRYGWICRHLCAKVIQLGRLQFEQGLFQFPFLIYYDLTRLKCRTFAQQGVVCDTAGYIDDKAGSWSTTLSVTDDTLVAHEVDQKLGRISRKAVSVPLSELKLICTHNTPVLFVHIPEGNPLAPSLVDASFSWAQSMMRPTLFVCNSWLLDPELSKVLLPKSNIYQFMQRFQKFPVSFATPQIYERVFGYSTTQSDILAWKCGTSLQKRVRQHMLHGGVFRTMGGYIPACTEL